MTVSQLSRSLPPEISLAKNQFFEQVASSYGFSGNFSRVELDSSGNLFIHQNKQVHALSLSLEQKETAKNLTLRQAEYFERLKLRKYTKDEKVQHFITEKLPDRGSKNLVGQVISASMLSSSWANLGRNFSDLAGHVPGPVEERSWSYSLNGISELSYLWNTYNSYSDYQSALHLKDEEGMSDAKRRGLRSSFQIVGAGLGISASSLEQLNLNAASNITNVSAMGVFDVAGIMGFAIATQKVFRLLRFRRKITQYWNNNDLSLKKKTLGVLNHFKENLSLTKKEVQAIRKKYADPAQQNLELSLLLEKKVSKFKRRIGNQSYELLVKDRTLDRLLEEIKTNPGQAIANATHLIETILQENTKQTYSNILLLVGSLLAVVTSLVSQFFGVGVVIKILKLLTSLIYVSYMTYMAYLYFKYRPENGYDFASIRFTREGGSYG